jgi:hypothetical protein
MHRPLRWLPLLCLLATLLASPTGNGYPVAAQTSLPPIQPQAFSCYSGASQLGQSACLVVPVVLPDNTPAVGALVRMNFEGRSLEAIAAQLPNQPIGSAMAALDGAQIRAFPGSSVIIQIAYGEWSIEKLIVLQPEAKTSTQILDPITVGVTELAPSLIWGTATWQEARTQPLNNIDVRLYLDANNTLIATDTTKPRGNSRTPTFELNPQGMKPGDLLRIEASGKADLNHSNDTFTTTNYLIWNNQAINVPLVFGWDCLKEIHRSKIGSVPESFCLAGRAILDGQAVENAQISVEVFTKPSVITNTVELVTFGQPGYVLDIGRSINGLPPTTPLTITAIYEGAFGQIRTTLDTLDANNKWGTRIDITLRTERTSAVGLAGGSPGPIALTKVGDNLSVYAGLNGGGVVGGLFKPSQPISGTTWLRLIGNTPHALPDPEVSALLAMKHNAVDDTLDDTLIAGMNSGEIAFSITSGQQWVTLPFLAATPITALAYEPLSSTLYIASRSTLWRTPFSPLNWSGVLTPTAITLGFSPNSLAIVPATISTRELYAGATDGLRVSTDDGQTWSSPFGVASISALASFQRSPTTWNLLVGTNTGVFVRNFDNSLEAAGLSGPVLGLTVSANGQYVAATTVDGIFISPLAIPGFNWQRVAASDSLASAPSVGVPDIFDLTSGSLGGTPTLIAATGTGIFSSTDDGFSWQPFGVTGLTSVVRSVDLLSDGSLLALAAQGLYRITNGQAIPVNGLPTNGLNGSVVRASPEGQTILVGRNAGEGNNLYVSTDGGVSWTNLAVGENLGVTTIVWLASPIERAQALIASDGSGLFGWTPGSSNLTALPRFVGGEERERVGAVLVSGSGESCRIFAGTFGPVGRIYSSSCSLTGVWTPMLIEGSSPTAIQALASLENTPDVLYAATSEGILKGSIDKGSINEKWGSLFGRPLRPLSLLVPGSYNTNRMLVAGGFQAGVLLLSDTSPDIIATIEVPELARGNEMLTYTVKLANQGLLPVTAFTANLTIERTFVTLEPADQVLTWTGMLMPSEVVTKTVYVRVKSNVRPEDTVRATLQADQVSNEQFLPNNLFRVTTNLLYRQGADLEVRSVGQSASIPGESASLRFLVNNVGDKPSGPDAKLIIQFSPAITVETWPDKATKLISNSYSLSFSDFPVNAPPKQIAFTYKLPTGIPTDTVLTATATLSLPMTFDDREANNNSARVNLTVMPETPSVLVITNRRRFYFTPALSNALTAYLQEENGLEIDLGEQTQCEKGNIACGYEAFDEAIANLAEVAQSTSSDREAIDKAAAGAIEARNTLVNKIITLIKEKRASFSSAPKYLVIVGSDDVIPGFAYAPGSDNAGQALKDESDIAKYFRPTDTNYSVTAIKHYVGDQAYRDLKMFTGRLPGNASQILAMLNLYDTLDGQINLSNGAVAGYAEGLTDDVQREVCNTLKSRVRLPEGFNCTSLPLGIQDQLSALLRGSSISSISAHGSPTAIGNLESSAVPTASLDVMNLLLLLGCHSGVVPNHSVIDQPSLVNAFNGIGQPLFGYTGYAYASTSNTSGLVYSERLHKLLVDELIGANNKPSATLGEALFNAQASYGAYPLGSTPDPLAVKTLNTITLYGLPTLRFTRSNSGTSPEQSIARGNIPSLGEGATLSLAPTFTPGVDTNGTFYTATLSNAEAINLYADGHTIQPGARAELPEGFIGGLLSGGSYRDQPAVDPIVLRAVPVSNDPPIFIEPSYNGSANDWALQATSYVRPDGGYWLTVSLGQWAPRGMVQRLFDQLDFRLIARTELITPTAPILGTVSVKRATNGKVTVSINGSRNLKLAEVVLFEAGTLRVVPLTKRGTRFQGSFIAEPEMQFLIQGMSPSGGTLFAVNRGLFYRVPQNKSENSQLRIEPVSGKRKFPVAYRMTNTGRQPVDIFWSLDCRQPWQDRGVCSDSLGATTLWPGEVFTKGLGMVCGRWQLNIEYGGGRRWSGSAERPAICNGPHDILLPLADRFQIATERSRIDAEALESKSVSGKVYIYLSPLSGIKQVSFWLDKIRSAPRNTEYEGYYDFVGTIAGEPQPFDTRNIANGRHTIFAVITYKDGSTRTISASFIVNNRR